MLPKQSENGRIEKELAYERRSLYNEILSSQIERLEKNKPLKTPKVREVIKFQSTLKEIEERKKRPKIYPRKNKI